MAEVGFLAAGAPESFAGQLMAAYQCASASNFSIAKGKCVSRLAVESGEVQVAGVGFSGLFNHQMPHIDQRFVHIIGYFPNQLEAICVCVCVCTQCP